MSVELLGKAVDACEALTQTVEGKISDINSKVAESQAKVDQFLANAQPETRYEQEIYIGGSADYFYPVWFRFKDNSHGISKLTIARNYFWNGAEGERPLTPNSNHQAALLLEIEGNSYAWHGDANFLQIKRFHERYHSTVSHIDFMMYCKAEPVNSELPLFGSASEELSAQCRKFSGLYLRGGGLTYRIIKNWQGDVNFHDGSAPSRRTIEERIQGNGSARWFAEPIPVEDKTQPTLSSTPWANHPYPTPTES